MKVGIPREVKNHEYRVAITPSGVHELSRNGHDVYVESGAGVGSSIPDDSFAAAGATILPAADDIWAAGDLSAWILLALASLPLAVPLWRTVSTRSDGPALNGALAGTGRLLAVYSLLLSAGVLLS